MLLNLLLNYITNNTENYKFFNKILIIGFISYSFSYLIFGNFVLLIAIFDSIYFLKQYMKLPKNIKTITNNNKLTTTPINNIIEKINEIDYSEDIKKVKIISIDPEFETDKYIPYKYNLKDTFTQVTNNLS